MGFTFAFIKSSTVLLVPSVLTFTPIFSLAAAPSSEILVTLGSVEPQSDFGLLGVFDLDLEIFLLTFFWALLLIFGVLLIDLC